MKLILLCLSSFWLTIAFSQKEIVYKNLNEIKIDKSVKSLSFSGVLVGIKKKTNELYYFLYTPNLKATANLISDKFNDQVICGLDETEKEKLSVCKILINIPDSTTIKIKKWKPQRLFVEITLFSISNQNNTLPFTKSIFSTINLRPTGAKPPSFFEVEPGFQIAAPPELSIYLIYNEIKQYYSDSSNKQQLSINDGFSIIPKYSISNIDSLKLNLKEGIGSNNFFRLGKAMEIYNYCYKHLDSTSFLKQEGAELIQKTDSLKLLLSNLSNKITNKNLPQIDSIKTELQNSTLALKMYYDIINQIQFLKEKIEFRLKDSFIKLDN